MASQNILNQTTQTDDYVNQLMYSVLSDMYLKSDTFKDAYDSFSATNGALLWNFVSTGESGIGSPPSGYAQYDVAIQISLDDFDGDTYREYDDQGQQTGTGKSTLNRIIAHEFGEHLVDYLNGNSNSTEDTETEDKIMQEAYGEDGRGSYWELDSQGNQVLDGNGDPIPNGIDGSGDNAFENSYTTTTFKTDTSEIILDTPASPLLILKPEGEDDDGETVDADYVDDVKDKVDAAENEASPLVLDLDGDGIELTSLNSADSVYWKHDPNSDFAQASGWVKGDDGLLAIDSNDDGIINDSGELFGDQTGYANGFSALAQLDSNSDGLITSADTDWDDLIVWTDDNGDGFSQEDEMQSLNDLSITEIDLGFSDVNYALAGNNVYQESSFKINGNTRDIVDAYFATSTTNTIYNADFTPDFATIGLPSLRGYGELPTLSIGMSLDNDDTDSDSLISLVADFKDLDFDDVFNDDTVALDNVRDIMFRWAGVDGVSTNSRGDNIDARELEYLEKMVGAPILQAGYQPNPAYWAGQGLQDAFQTAQYAVTARLILQTVGEDLFTGTPIYNAGTDNIDGITGLDLTTLATLGTSAGDSQLTTDTTAFWKNVVMVIDELVGLSNLSSSDYTALDDEITDSDATLDLQDIIDDLAWQTVDGTQSLGTSGDDTLSTGTGNDELIGYAGNDELDGLAGADIIKGDGGNDTLIGGSGDDLMYGGSGNDTYEFSVNHGTDAIIEDGGTADKILFGPYITANDLTITRVSNDALQIDFDITQGDGSIVIENYFEDGGDGVIETLEFDDATTHDLTAANYTLTGTDLSETLEGVEYGGGEDDTIHAEGGNDTVYGYDGDDELHGGDGNDHLDGAADDDTLYGDAGHDSLYGRAGNDTLDGGAGDDRLQADAGNDTLDGGAGDDTLFGGYGNDTYKFSYGDGDDVVDEYGNWADVNKLLFDSSVTEAMVEYARVGLDLKIIIDGSTGGSVLVKSHFNSSYKRLHEVEFDNGTVVTLSSIDYVTYGTDDADYITGISSGGGIDDTIYGLDGDDDLRGKYGEDTIYGGAGDDVIYGDQADDFLSGGTGDDTLYGSYGDDTYAFNYGDGNDTFSEYASSSEVNIIQLGSGITSSMVSITREGYDMKIDIDGGSGGTITVDRHFQSTYRTLEKIVFDNGTDADIDLTTYDYTTYGTSSGETIYGVTIGGGDEDTIYAGAGNDDLRGKDGDDVLYGEAGNDYVRGENGNDTLYGGDGADYLYGYYGDDVLYGGDGLDNLTGDYGADTFVLEAGSAYNDIDVITDFDTSENDVLDLSDLLSAYDPLNDLLTDFVQITQSGSHSTVKVDADGTGSGSLMSQVATLNYTSGLTDEDALVSSGHLIV